MKNYKNYLISPFWTQQQKCDLLSELKSKDELIESLEEQLKTEQEYSQSILKCSEKLQQQRNEYRNIFYSTFNTIKQEVDSFNISFIDDVVKNIKNFWYKL